MNKLKRLLGPTRFIAVLAARTVIVAGLSLTSVQSLAEGDLHSPVANSSRLEQAFDSVRVSRRDAEVRPSVDVIHVAPADRDDTSESRATGAEDDPLRGLPAAQQRAREMARGMRDGQRPLRALHVVLAPGRYVLDRTLEFDERDSGQPGAPVVYRAQQTGTVVVSGGVEMTSAGSDGASATFELPAGRKVEWRGAQQLYVEGRRAPLARMPDAGDYWYVQPPNERTSLVGPSDAALGPDARAWLASIDTVDRRDAVLNLFQAWTTGRHRLRFEEAGRALLLVPVPRWPASTFGRSQRFYVENLRAALDAPGEWFGSGKTVTYLRRPGERGRRLVAVLPTLTRLITIGHRATGRPPTHDLELQGIDFEHTVFVTPDTGYADNQAASGVGAAIEVNGAQRIVIDRCRVSRTGGHGIWLRRGVREATVSGTLLSDLGAGGVRIGDVVGPTAEHPSSTAGNRVVGNMITRTGQLLPGGVGIWVGQAWDILVAHNLITDTSYTGISVGWRWGFGPARSGRNEINSNLLVNIGQGMLADLGGIYTLGESPGTVIRDNVVREVRSYPEYGPGGRAAGFGIYQDEGSSDTVVERNLVIGTDSGGYYLHYGRNNQIRGNLFAHGVRAEMDVSKNEGGADGVLAVGNVIVAAATRPFARLASAPVVRFEGNVVSAESAAQAEVLRRCAGGCRIATMAVSAGPAAKAVSFSGLPVDAERAWREVLAKAGPDLPALESIPVVPVDRPAIVDIRPTTLIHVDIALAPVGRRPVGLNYRPLGDEQSIRIESRSGPGEPDRCLNFRDGPNFERPVEPFAFATLGRTSGRWSARFSLWTDGRSEFVHEWRDDDVPYRVGPRLVVDRGSVRVGGQEVTTINARAWYTFDVSVEMADGTGTWDLLVTHPDGREQRLAALPLADPLWAELRWVGLISRATTQTQTCVGSFDVRPAH